MTFHHDDKDSKNKNVKGKAKRKIIKQKEIINDKIQELTAVRCCCCCCCTTSCTSHDSISYSSSSSSSSFDKKRIPHTDTEETRTLRRKEIRQKSLELDDVKPVRRWLQLLLLLLLLHWHDTTWNNYTLFSFWSSALFSFLFSYAVTRDAAPLRVTKDPLFWRNCPRRCWKYDATAGAAVEPVCVVCVCRFACFAIHRLEIINWQESRESTRGRGGGFVPEWWKTQETTLSQRPNKKWGNFCH